MFRRLFGSLVVMSALAFTGCGGDPGSAFRAGVPTTQTVKLALPGDDGQALTSRGTTRQGLEGETAALYAMTRSVSKTINGGVGATLDLVQRVVAYPATTVTGSTAVWGPYTEALSPNTWKLTVTQRAPNDFTYLLEGKGKTEADTAFRVVLSGSHLSTGTNLGSGTLLLDWNQAQGLPEHDANVGTATVSYAHATSSGPVDIDAQFSQVRDDATGALVDARYHYAQDAAQHGALEFSQNKDVTGGAALEHLTIKSRWQPTGEGRADVQATGGDLTQPATLSECWDGSFLSRYLTSTFAPAADYGAASTCVFTAAEYSAL
jgi:hypothetical protein